MDFNTDVASGDFVVEGMHETIAGYRRRRATEEFERKYPRTKHERTFSEGETPAGRKQKKVTPQHDENHQGDPVRRKSCSF